jgi:hypothetical protein
LTEQLALIPSPLETSVQLVLSNAVGPSESDVNATDPVGTLGLAAVSVTVATQFVDSVTRKDEGVQATVVVVSGGLTVSVSWPLLDEKPLSAA